jgi:hypothetical protein
MLLSTAEHKSSLSSLPVMSTQMNIETGNAFAALSSDESEDVDELSTPSRQHPLSVWVTMKEQEEQIVAEVAALNERLHQLRLASLQEVLNAKRTEVDVVERQAAVMSFPSLYHNSPVAAVHQPALPNHHLFTGVRYASAIQTPISAAALAKKQSIATLLSFSPAIDPSVPTFPIAVHVTLMSIICSLVLTTVFLLLVLPSIGDENKQAALTAYRFVYRSVAEAGRYKLSEAQPRTPYDESRCYDCYQPRHPKKMTVAFSPLN